MIAHLALFSPGASLPNFVHVLERYPEAACVMTFSGYQFNLEWSVSPSAASVLQRSLHSRLPVTRARRRRPRGIAWPSWEAISRQDGGVVMLYAASCHSRDCWCSWAKKLIARSGIGCATRRQTNFVRNADHGSRLRQMLTRIQQQSNMVVQADPTELVVQKLANSGIDFARHGAFVYGDSSIA